MHTGGWWKVAGLSVAFAIAYGTISVVRHWQFGSNYDLAIFDQAIWHASRFETPGSTISGFSSILGDHFYPIVFTLAPLYWIAPHAETLLIAQAVLLAASIVPVYLFLDARVGHRQAFFLCIAYGSFWGLQRTALSDFHELAFAPLLIALAMLAVDRQRWTWVWILIGLLCLVKEDVILVGVGLAMYLATQGERRRAWWLGATTIATFAGVVLIAIPSQNDAGGWGYGRSASTLLAAPWRIPLLLVTPAAKLHTIALWLAPFAFLPAFSPLILVAIPVAVARLLSASPNHWGYGGHYTAPLAPILALAAGDALRRLQDRWPASTRGRWTAGLIAFSVCSSMVLPGHQPLLRLVRPSTYAAIPTQEAAREALALIPPSASVTAQGAIAPHLTHRREVYLLEAPRDADFVIASSQLTPWPVASLDDLESMLAGYRARGYRTAFERDGWTVLARGR